MNKRDLYAYNAARRLFDAIVAVEQADLHRVHVTGETSPEGRIINSKSLSFELGNLLEATKEGLRAEMRAFEKQFENTTNNQNNVQS